MNKILAKLKFDDKGLIPAIIQDEKTGEVLTLCYMNKDALARTLDEGFIYVFRRSKQRLMKKGETSGCVQKVRSMRYDCEGNSLLFRVDQDRAACHTGYFTCYYQEIDKEGNVKTVSRRVFDPDTVYRKGTDALSK